MQKKIHIVIPARYNSSRLPGKPLLDLAGTPMVVRVYKKAKAALPNCNCVVAIDDQRVAKVLSAYDVPYIMTKASHISGTDRISEVCYAQDWDSNDIVINIQGDEPLIPIDLLQKFYKFTTETEDIEAATIYTPFKSHNDLLNENTVKVISTQQNKASYFSRYAIPYNRDLDISEVDLSLYKKHIGIYAYKVEVINKVCKQEPITIEDSEKLEQLRILWMGYSIHLMSWEHQLPNGIDTQEDADQAITLLQEYNI